mmetsp:Transcript_11871/g.25341  ORF Transcript_11871/g.25341 Transcript_11871/m.25341 type:complete len:134 (+) Transcript_11871:103-504(+)
MSAQSLIAAMDRAGGRSNLSSASMAFEEWCDENASRVFWNTQEAKEVFSYFKENDAVMHHCIEYLVEKFKEMPSATYTCGAVAAIISVTDNESVKSSVVEEMAPLIRDPQNKQVILDVIDNAAVRMSVEEYFL